MVTTKYSWETCDPTRAVALVLVSALTALAAQALLPILDNSIFGSVDYEHVKFGVMFGTPMSWLFARGGPHGALRTQGILLVDEAAGWVDSSTPTGVSYVVALPGGIVNQLFISVMGAVPVTLLLLLARYLETFFLMPTWFFVLCVGAGAVDFLIRLTRIKGQLSSRWQRAVHFDGWTCETPEWSLQIRRFVIDSMFPIYLACGHSRSGPAVTSDQSKIPLDTTHWLYVDFSEAAAGIEARVFGATPLRRFFARDVRSIQLVDPAFLKRIGMGGDQP